MAKKSALFIALVLFTLVNCKKESRQEEISQSTVSPGMIFLVVEKVVSGMFFEQVFSEPFGLAQSSDGSIFVVDKGTNRVIKFNSEFEPQSQTGGYGLGTETFNSPTYVTIDNALNIYVSDENNRRVARLDLRLNYVDDVKFADEEDPFLFGYPSGIGVTSYGELWIGDRDKNRLCLFNNVGKFDRFVGDFGSREGQLSQPEKIAADPANRFYVCDAGHRRILIYDEYGNFMRKIESGEFDYPMSLAVDKDFFWILDGGTSSVLLADKNGQILKHFGHILLGERNGLNGPSDIILLEDGRLLISDTANHRLLVCRIERGETN